MRAQCKALWHSVSWRRASPAQENPSAVPCWWQYSADRVAEGPHSILHDMDQPQINSANVYAALLHGTI